MKYNTVIFDFDGTLLNTLRDLAGAVNHALKKHGYPTHEEEKVRLMIGNGVRMLVSRALPMGFDTPDYDEVFADFREHYSHHCSDNTGVYDGVLPMLRRLKEAGVKMAISTNKYQAAAEELRKQFFADYIDIIVGDLETRQRKPAPDSVFAALDALGVDRTGAVYIGDTEVDRETAENSGLDFIAVSWGYRDRQQLADMGIEKIANTPEALCRLVLGE